MPTRTTDIEAILNKAQPQRNWFWPSITVVTLGVVALGLWFWLSGPNASSASQYITESVDRGDIVVTVTATGSVEPTNIVEISTELSGTVRSVEFDFNDRVKSGDVLARLNTETQEANLTRARASVAAAEAHMAEIQVTLEETRQSYDRSIQLDEKGFASTQSLMSAKSNFDRAATALQSAEANVAIAKADLELNEANLAKACICSPIDGIILDRNVEVGQIVAASFSAPTLFTIAQDLEQMQLQVDIDEADIGRVSDGDRANFTVEAYQDKFFTAKIAELRFAPLTVNGVVTYKAILAVDNTELLLRPGMTATASIIVSQSLDVLRVPNAALRFKPPTQTDVIPKVAEQRILWVLDEEEPKKVIVKTGVSDGNFTEIISGDLALGDPVIVDVGAL